MLDGRVQLFQAEEFQSQRPPLAPALTLEPCQVDSVQPAQGPPTCCPTSARLPVDFLQWRNAGDILVSVSEDDGRWRVGGWHMLQNSVGDWSALPATEGLLGQIVSPAELARMAAARANPLNAAALKSGRDRRAAMSRSSGSLSILGDVNPPAFSDSFQHVALASRVASATILEDLPASPQLLARASSSPRAVLDAASSPAAVIRQRPPAGAAGVARDAARRLAQLPVLAESESGRRHRRAGPAQQQARVWRTAGLRPERCGRASRGRCRPRRCCGSWHTGGAGRQASQAGGYSPPAQHHQHQQHGRGGRVPPHRERGGDPGAGGRQHAAPHLPAGHLRAGAPRQRSLHGARGCRPTSSCRPLTRRVCPRACEHHLTSTDKFNPVTSRTS